MKNVKNLLKIVAVMFLLVVTLMATLYNISEISTISNKEKLGIIGFSALTVESNSMAPVFTEGDMIFISKVNPQKLAVGDVVCYRAVLDGQKKLNAHRIVEIYEDKGVRSYLTKGDSNLAIDPYRVKPENVVGKYIGKLAGAGKFLDRFHGSVVALLAALLPLVVFIGYLIYSIVRDIQKLKQLEIEKKKIAKR